MAFFNNYLILFFLVIFLRILFYRFFCRKLYIFIIFQSKHKAIFIIINIRNDYETTEKNSALQKDIVLPNKRPNSAIGQLTIKESFVPRKISKSNITKITVLVSHYVPINSIYYG